MVLLGLALLLLGVGLGTAAYLGVRDETGTVTLEALGFSRDAQPLELLLLGAAAMLLFALGWALVAAAARRRGRFRRDEREAERLVELERAAEADHLEQERRFEEASLRDEDLRNRESHLDAWAQELDAREREVARLEEVHHQRVSPSVADVVTGRAEGSVSEGTAHWSHTTPRHRPGAGPAE
ncbi:hypothetical protein OO014_05780 [Intrasporangium calvum]|uniref:Lipopolysaccharide assembly protein A domain-containing protein n=1 Tax=Intrasporangium calvum TaxID=53358 RepID=A0ABT5GG04_9MICO|nr:hypothetical protein [Intrasporangium calvum]MDC5696760.1 hypothetical protein [Intrasporangium calvum]